MKKLLVLSAAAVLSLSLPAMATPLRAVVGAQASAASTAAVPLTGAARTQALADASRALSATRTVQGRFTQLAPDGSRTTGAYYMSRPGRARFEYDSPAPLLIVSDGTTVAISDRDLRNTDRVPLRSTPLFFVLGATVNLERDFRITAVARQGDLLLITARDRTGEIDGELTLALQGTAMTLRSWEALDATNARTTVRLDTVQTGQRLSPRLFVAEDLQRQRDRR
jgi:outer membrane lipoprotein-sorting protein